MSTAFGNLFFPTREEINTTPRSYIERDPDGGTQNVYFVTIPTSLLVPCPSSLHELRDNGGSISISTIFACILLMFIDMVEQDFYLTDKNVSNSSARSAARAPSAQNNAYGYGTTLGAEADANDNSANESTDYHARMSRARLFMEYIVSDQTVTNDNYKDISLIDILGIRFVFVFRGDATELTTVLNRFFKQVKEKGQKGKKQNQPPQYLPQILKNQGISTWGDYQVACSRYVSDDSDMTAQEVSETDGRPRCGIVTHPEEAFSSRASLDVLHAHTSYESLILAAQREAVVSQDANSAYLFEFGVPNLVYEFKRTWINKAAIFFCVLPRSIRWQERDKSAQLTNGTKLSILQNLRDARVECMFRNAEVIQENKNDLKDIAKLLKERIKNLRNTTRDNVERREIIKRYRKDAVGHLQSIWAEEANISDSIKEIVSWSAKQDSWTLDPGKMQIMDKRLSSFGNMIATDYYNLEFNVGVSTTHGILYTVLTSAFNAYHYKPDTLHLNVLLLGAGATGKSFILNTISDLLIPSTTESISNQTEKALATGKDKNDHISIFHEMPSRLISSESKGGASADTGDTLFKDLLTSGKISTQSMIYTDDGRRIEQNYVSERIGVFLCATNEREDKMHESMKSRFVTIPVHEYHRDGASVIDRQASRFVHDVEDSGESALSTVSYEDFQHRIRMRQTMVAMVERAIAANVIQEPDTSIAKRGIARAVAYINKEYIRGEGAGNREVSNIQTYARTLTVIHACERFANFCATEQLSINFKNLQGIQRFLVCTDEIAVFALSTFFPSIIKFITMQAMEIIMKTIEPDLQKDMATGDLCENDSGYYYTIPAYESRSTLYSKMQATMKNDSTCVKISKENMMVTFNQLLTLVCVQNGRPIIIFEKSSGILQVNKDYVNCNFEKKDDVSYKLKVDMHDIFNKVLDHAFQYKHQKRTEHAITAFPLDEKRPFILKTITIGRDNCDRPMKDKDHGYQLHRRPNNGVIQTPYYIQRGAITTYNVDMTDFVYTTYYKNHVSSNVSGSSRGENGLFDGKEHLCKVSDDLPTVSILTLEDEVYPMGLKAHYKSFHKDRYNENDAPQQQQVQEVLADNAEENPRGNANTEAPQQQQDQEELADNVEESHDESDSLDPDDSDSDSGRPHKRARFTDDEDI